MDYEAIISIKDRAEKNLHSLSKTILDGLKPPAGPYGFFHHSAHSLERLQNCQRIVKRLFAGRVKLTELAKQQNTVMPKDWPAGKPYPEEVQKIMRQEDEVNAYMKQDLETLYMFGGILLDQLSLQAIAIANLNLPKKHPFVELVNFFESGQTSILDPIWRQLKEKFLWLHYQLRFYRNRFVVHANRPWQRGTTRSVYGDDFNLFTPTPPGWLDDKKLNEEIKKLIHLAPDHIKNAPDDYWEKERPRALIERIFNNIGNINDKQDREKVASIFGQVGGSTPTFQIIATKLFELVESETELLDNIARANLQTINLGQPHRTSSLI